MPQLSRFMATAAVAVALAGVTGAAQSGEKSAISEVRQELMQLPYYGVFDYLGFKYDKGTVTLVGFAYHPALKRDAQAAVKRASGVDSVVNRIEELPLSPNDDDLRWKTYYAIYRDPFLARYAPGGGVLWGHRHGLGGNALRPFGEGDFAGTEPAGDYPIHIIVKSGKIVLLGVVDNASDKNVAGIRARGVSGSFGVENKLMVEGGS